MRPWEGTKAAADAILDEWDAACRRRLNQRGNPSQNT
jgi:hypothetical protein